MQLPFSKRSALSLAVLSTALAAFVGASIGSAAPAKNVPIPPNPLKTVLAQVKGLTIKGGFPNNPRDTKLRQLAIAQLGPAITPTDITLYEQASSSSLSWQGLARYWRKRAEAS